MRTITTTTVESQTAEETTWWFPVDDTEDTDYLEVHELSEKRLTELCKRYGVSEEFVTEVNGEFSRFRDAVSGDLAEIWKRLDAIENE